MDFSVLWTETREKILPGFVTVSTKWYPTKQGCWRLLNKEGHWAAPDMKHIEDTGSLMTLHLFIFAIFFKLIFDLCICFLTWLCSYPSISIRTTWMLDCANYHQWDSRLQYKYMKIFHMIVVFRMSGCKLNKESSWFLLPFTPPPPTESFLMSIATY